MNFFTGLVLTLFVASCGSVTAKSTDGGPGGTGGDSTGGSHGAGGTSGGTGGGGVSGTGGASGVGGVAGSAGTGSAGTMMLDGGPACFQCNGLVGWWRFEDDLSANGAVVTDSSTAGNDGKLVEGSAASVPGKVGNGFLLSQQTEIDVPNSPTLNPSSSMTVSYWLMLSKIPEAKQAGVMKRTDGMNDATFQAVVNGGNADSGPGILEFSYFNGGWYGRITKAPIAIGAWHLLSFVFDASILDSTLYVDGQVAESTSVTSGAPLSTSFASTLKINAGDANAHLDGVMDELRIHNRALSAAEILAYYQKTK